MRILTAVLAVALALLLGGCDTTAPKAARPDVRFSHLTPIVLDVAKIEIAERYRPPVREPNVDHLMSPSPLMVMRRWAEDRLRAGGPTGTAKFIIVDASVVETPLDKPSGFKGFFTNAQAVRYNLVMQARLEVQRRDGGEARGFADALVKRERTMPEEVTLNKREDILFEFVAGAGDDFNAQMEQQIEKHLKLFVR
jgi:hypothetical protein